MNLDFDSDDGQLSFSEPETTENQENLINQNGENKDDENKAVDITRKRRKIPKLTPDVLVNDSKGVEHLMETFSRIRFRGAGHAIDNLRLLMTAYREWAHSLYPRASFEEFITRCEKMSSSTKIQHMLSDIRADRPFNVNFADDIAQLDNLEPTPGIFAEYDNMLDIPDEPMDTVLPTETGEQQFDNYGIIGDLDQQGTHPIAPAVFPSPAEATASPAPQSAAERAEANRQRALALRAAREKERLKNQEKVGGQPHHQQQPQTKTVQPMEYSEFEAEIPDEYVEYDNDDLDELDAIAHEMGV
eukprot:GCRY01003478.1.p1 GENE.GCRY01003478.1~~GCRY01003478.1.p1  ORF type:complete len:302 (+),score=47.24 GCRY01003478.1:180-1085(+)